MPGLRKLPLLPSQHPMHLMAKAAVAVYEAAAENQQAGESSMAYSESLARRVRHVRRAGCSRAKVLRWM